MIRWLTAVPPTQGDATATIQLSLTGPTGPWQNIATNIPDTGCYQGLVAGTGSTHCRVKITVTTSTTSATAISPADFTIIGGCIAHAHGPYHGAVEAPLHFTGSAENGTPPYQYHWTFGDGATSDEQNPTHTYHTAGNYTVTLTVTDGVGIIACDSTWALIAGDNIPPTNPTIDGPATGKPGRPHNYTVVATDSNNDTLSYFIDWGDNTTSGWIGPFPSGQTQTIAHTWAKRGAYTIRCKARDVYGVESDWGSLHVRMPFIVERPMFPLLHWLLDHIGILWHFRVQILR